MNEYKGIAFVPSLDREPTKTSEDVISKAISAIELARATTVSPSDDEIAVAKSDALRRIDEYTERELKVIGVPCGLRYMATTTFDIGLQTEMNTEELKSVLNKAWKKLCLGGWVILQGGAGIGKTHLAIRWLWATRRSSPFSSASEFSFIQAYDWANGCPPQGDNRSKYYYNTIKPNFIVIDDLGQESKFGCNAIGDLVRSIYDNNKRVIITTNLNDTEIIERYGDPVRSRMLDKRNKTVRFPSFAKDLR